MRYQGRITSWKNDQGFGFITRNGGSDQVFVHINAFKNRRRPAGNAIVTYELEIDQKGRERAHNVAFVGDRSLAIYSSRTRRSISFAIAIIFFILIVASVFVGKLPIFVLGLYLVTSIIAFVAYALDKSAAQNDQQRTSESTLHLFGLIGGWPGALVAQSFLRHKSKKQSFQIIFWIMVIFNCGGFIWLLTPEGSSALSSILGRIV